MELILLCLNPVGRKHLKVNRNTPERVLFQINNKGTTAIFIKAILVSLLVNLNEYLLKVNMKSPRATLLDITLTYFTLT